MESNVLIPIGKRISEIRRAHGVTQETLAEQLDVSPKHISHTERGTSCLSLKNLMEFCDIFECSLDYIIWGTKDNNALSKLPNEIIDILHTGKDEEIKRLYRYLQMYIELTKSPN